MNILVFFVVLSILIFVHEFGHFLAAIKNGIFVEEFGFGFPPRIFGKKIGKTIYSINAIPIGGFVKLYGEEYDEIGKKEGKNGLTKDQSFAYKKPWQKILVLVAGVIGNFLLGWFIISYLFTQGVPVPSKNVIIERVLNNSPAKTAGIQVNDQVSQMWTTDSSKKTTIVNTEEFASFVKKAAGKEIIIAVYRNGNLVELHVKPRLAPPDGEGPIGVVITSFTEKKYVWYEAPFYGLIEAFNITRQIAAELVKTLFRFVTFQKQQVDVAGPIGIAQYTGQAIKFGRNALLELVALLSLNLAIINILPFPALDGGRLVFVIYEWITKRRLNKTVEKYLNIAGFAMLIFLAIVISLHDIMKLYK